MDNRKKTTIAAVVVLLLIAAAAWALRGAGVDPQVAALESQRERVFSPDATDAERQAFRQAVDALTDDQRRQLFERGRPEMQRRMAERMNELFNQSPEQLRREARQRAADVIAARKNPGPDRGPRGGGPPGGPPGGRGPRTEAQRDAMQKQRLDFVDPGTRAQFSEFRRMINEELKSQGQDELSGRDMRAIFGGRRG